jgi:hypothetical protein
MSDVKLGQLAGPDAKRDAVHVAVVPVVAAKTMTAGTPVGINEDGSAIETPRQSSIGVVDPFLTCPVELGESFWLFLKPGTVSNLRHSWSHPLFEKESDV